MALQTPARDEATFFAPLKNQFYAVEIFMKCSHSNTHSEAVWEIVPFPLRAKPTRISTAFQPHKRNETLSHTHSRIPSLPSFDQNSTLCTADPDSSESP